MKANTKTKKQARKPSSKVAKPAYPDGNPKTVFGVTKPPLHAIPAVALLHLGLGMYNGKRKYGLVNWRKDPVTESVYYDAAFRHLLSWWDGEDYDPVSRVHHLGHAMACCAIILDATTQGTMNFDRPQIKGKTADEIQRLTKPLPNK